MPTRKPQTESKAGKCTGGASEGCRHDEHEQSKKRPDILCFRCHTRLGCGVCVVMDRELSCLHCKSWGTRLAAEAHGAVVGDYDRLFEKAKGIAKSAVGD